MKMPNIKKPRLITIKKGERVIVKAQGHKKHNLVVGYARKPFAFTVSVMNGTTLYIDKNLMTISKEMIL